MEKNLLLEQKHGKSRVRVARVWRQPDGTQIFVEWTVNISLYSDCIPAYTDGDNSDIVATDSMKNTVYAKAKECLEQLSAEEFGILLGKHFTSTYPKVTSATIKIVEKPWERILINGTPHEHGFKLGTEKHTTEININKCGEVHVTSGVEGLALLKTTQSGFVGFIRDRYTLLPETKERILATEISAVWRYSKKPSCYTTAYISVRKLLVDVFFGSPHEGVYSPSVQNTLYFMAKAVLHRFPEIESIRLSMPNLHFLPVNLPNIVKFDHDVYLPTDEPHGTIEASLTRKNLSTFSKL
ncbi:hypothetical protein SUGI_1195240 [Cryptomeria japonica]|uniref:uricase-2 isozyme 2 n=1 Tax=Cryptomeria japonica TaxID=3369 RepID=UPI002414A2C7|nr:uricase-2 isozyme 2 [Cryptomeria japonica]GLJ55651.1 hypothetical protein SUGI_1195240 [Cryptomeria japonica]